MNAYRFIISIVFTSLLGSQLFSQKYATGLIEEVYDTNMVKLKKAPKTRADLPSYYSLKQYSPSIGNQGKLGSCVSWAAAYCALTIVKGVENGYQVSPFDPLDLHSRLKVLNNENVCSDGNRILQATKLLKSNGSKYYDYTSCSYISSSKLYSMKLYDWTSLSISAYNFKYVLSQEKSPILISCKCFKVGWHNNLSNGVWTGYYDPATADGGHAMVIIGYDDYKSGGAFLVQNSWGEDWGDGGCFWLKYDDMYKIIKDAIQYIPDPNKVSENEESTQYVRFYNDCSLTTYITLAQDYGDGYITEGWYSIQPNSYTDLDISSRYLNEVYWLAVASNNGNNVYWNDNSNTNGSSFCYDKVNAHKLGGNIDWRCPNQDNFYEINPSSRNAFVSQTLTCPSVKSRGGEEIKLAKSKESEIIMSLDYNKNWDGKLELIDPFSGNIIHQLKSKTESSEYDLYYLKDKEIVHFKGSKTDLLKLPYIKFEKKEYAEAYSKDLNSER